ncbi:class I SAM-dependent methyltransferase [Streptomyces sp. NPDC051976]|uniref:class I SAM-dependent methyltransferase n=1 Tax=Streptomyces sp. NPDC051976 TaxID=3154947 RepID=UPI003420373D
MQQLEISDLITAVDPHSGHRLPVRRAEVIQQLRACGDERAAGVVAGLPADADGVLDPHAVDRLLISVHTELQRLSEELRIGDRLIHVLGPLFTAIRATTGHPGPYRLVDVGCGLGYLIRWLAATQALGADVELVGVDLDAALVGEADRLAREEGLNCRFVHGNAFALPEAATVSDGPHVGSSARNTSPRPRDDPCRAPPPARSGRRGVQRLPRLRRP